MGNGTILIVLLWIGGSVMEILKEGLLLGIAIVLFVVIVICVIRFWEKLIQKSEFLRNFGDSIIDKCCLFINTVFRKAKR